MLRARNYPDAAAYRSFHERFAEPRWRTATGSHGRVQQLAAVRSAAGTSDRAGRGRRRHQRRRHRGERADTSRPSASTIRRAASSPPQEASTEAPVAVISETLARRLWPDRAARSADACGTSSRRRAARLQARGAPSSGSPATSGRPTTTPTGAISTRRGRPTGGSASFYVRTQPAGAARCSITLQRAAADIDRDAVINPPHGSLQRRSDARRDPVPDLDVDRVCRNRGLSRDARHLRRHRLCRAAAAQGGRDPRRRSARPDARSWESSCARGPCSSASERRSA